MSITTVRYDRKTFGVDAVQVTAENMEEVARWCQGNIQEVNASDDAGTAPQKYIHVRVHRPLNQEQTKAFVGYWVLYAGTGYKVYTDKAFKACFELPRDKAPKMQTTDPAAEGLSNDAAVQEAKPNPMTAFGYGSSVGAPFPQHSGTAGSPGSHGGGGTAGSPGSHGGGGMGGLH